MSTGIGPKFVLLLVDILLRLDRKNILVNQLLFL